MAAAFIVRRGGGGGSGATLVVTSAGTGTVTVSNSMLGKSYSKSVTAGGSVTFKGLKTGTWTVTLSNGTQPPATKTVTINADYSTSIAYFSATISITYPAESTCVVTNLSGETVASDSNTDSSAKTWTAIVNATDTYTITATSTSVSSKTKSTTVSITASGESKSATLSYELIIYENNSFPSAAGEIVSVQRATITKYETYFEYIKSSSDYGNKACTENPIDLTQYNSLKISCARNGNGYGKGEKFGVNDSALSSSVSLSGPYVVIPDYRNNNAWSSIATYSLDISTISGEKYIGIDGQDNNLRVYKIWLE